MGAAQHRAAAAAEDRHAAHHEAEFDPHATDDNRCTVVPGIYETCWQIVVNPTREHLVEARKHKRQARRHRAVARTLDEAEERACRELADYDRDLSPFFHTSDIAEVSARHDSVLVDFRAVRGLDARKMRRIVDCHRARNAVLGSQPHSMDYCLLVPEGVSVEVDDKTGHVRVTVHAENPDAWENLSARAHRLTERMNERTKSSPE